MEIARAKIKVDKLTLRQKEGFLSVNPLGTNILVDFVRRTEDKTNSNVLILGNSGQGKSFLLKLLLTNIRESGKSLICLDPEAEYEDLTTSLGGCYIDFMNGQYKINPLEPKDWGENSDEDTDENTPNAFRRITRLSQAADNRIIVQENLRIFLRRFVDNCLFF